MYTLPVGSLRPGKLLALCLLGWSAPTLALESAAPQAGSPIPHDRERALLETYVECIRGSALETRGRAAAMPASACASERSAYRATLPDEQAAQILETIDAGPPDSARR